MNAADKALCSEKLFSIISYRITDIQEGSKFMIFGDIGVFKGQCQGGPSISVPTNHLYPDAIYYSWSVYSRKEENTYNPNS